MDDNPEISSAQYAIEEQIYEYESMFPHDSAEKILIQVRVPPQTGVRGGTTTGDHTWYTAYTTPGGAQFLTERGYDVRGYGDENGVVITMPRHRRRRETQNLGRHHQATIRTLPPA